MQQQQSARRVAIDARLRVLGFEMKHDAGAMPGEGHLLIRISDGSLVCVDGDNNTDAPEEALSLAREWSDLVDDGETRAVTTTPAANRPMPNIYDDALLSQGACNLGGLVHGFDRVITQLQQESRATGRGTESINKHPVCVLFVEQLYHLTGYGQNYSAALRECEERSTRK